jgi:hypothetical protein
VRTAFRGIEKTGHYVEDMECHIPIRAVFLSLNDRDGHIRQPDTTAILYESMC